MASSYIPAAATSPTVRSSRESSFARIRGIVGVKHELCHVHPITVKRSLPPFGISICCLRHERANLANCMVWTANNLVSVGAAIITLEEPVLDTNPLRSPDAKCRLSYADSWMLAATWSEPGRSSRTGSRHPQHRTPPPRQNAMVRPAARSSGSSRPSALRTTGCSKSMAICRPALSGSLS